MANKFITILVGFCLAGCASDPTELRGTVNADMAAKVHAGLASGHRAFTINSSNGGQVLYAYAIVGQIKQVNGTLTVNGRCWSACSMIAVGLDAKQTAEADVRSHSSYVPGGADTAAVADWMEKHGYSRTLGTGPNLRRIDGTMAAPPDAWANRDPFH